MGQRLNYDDYYVWTDVWGSDLDKSGGWVKGVGREENFDPVFIYGDSRVYPGGKYVASLYIGSRVIATTGTREAKNREQAKEECEKWLKEQSKKLRYIIAYSAFSST